MFGRRDPQGSLFNVPFWVQGLVAQDSFCTRMGRLWSQRKVLQHIVVALRSLGPQPVVVLGPKGYYILCKAGDAIRTRDHLLGRQELCQLSYARAQVGVRGLEPPTSASQTPRATRLRYTPPSQV